MYKKENVIELGVTLGTDTSSSANGSDWWRDYKTLSSNDWKTVNRSIQITLRK